MAQPDDGTVASGPNGIAVGIAIADFELDNWIMSVRSVGLAIARAGGWQSIHAVAERFGVKARQCARLAQQEVPNDQVAGSAFFE